jgi:hypothetical protein
VRELMHNRRQRPLGPSQGGDWARALSTNTKQSHTIIGWAQKTCAPERSHPPSRTKHCSSSQMDTVPVPSRSARGLR